MNDFNRCKVTGVHWLKYPIEDIKIKVKLKPEAGLLTLPKFEDYTTESNIEQLENKTKEYCFKWQEKSFSLWELQRYSDVHNCISEDEMNYNDMINNLDYEASKIFTYIHEDYHLPLPTELKKTNVDSTIDKINTCLEGLVLGEEFKPTRLRDTSSTRLLFRSSENIVMEEEQWVAMHVAFDNSEYNDDSQLLVKQEATLLSLYYNKQHNYLLISPEVNDLELNPYTVETSTDTSLGYHYSVDVDFAGIGGGDDLVILLKKLHKKWERQQRQMINFVFPPLGKKQYFVSLELSTACEFDMDNLYVEFHVKVPSGVVCNDALHGKTHISKSVRIENDEKWHFGHIIDLNLEADTCVDSPVLQLFFEVISKDWCGRHRTEGYTYLPLALAPGRYSRQLSCSRPEENDSVEADSRRFFIGGCHLIKDFEVLVNPQLMDANFKLVTTGNLTLRWNVVSQASLPGSLPKPETFGVSSASALLLGAEAVLRQYRKARARLASATEGLATGDAD